MVIELLEVERGHVEHERVETLDVEDHVDGAADHRDVQRGAAGAAPRVGLGLLVLLEGGVGASERGLLVDEVGDAGAGGPVGAW